ncbi:MAG: AgmX/PglI C-terminal domain-containing protein [Myxococcales bacterium]|nr:AgmX/PglI C-terminal domain-containing protein [Myxococcales bacterium]MDP3501814.1 AgmX/PglI C-terminal domain-containing protein [Myxococcales bacterium]
MILLSTLIALTLHADPKGGNSTMKGLVKGLGASSSASADGGTSASVVNGIDLSKLPFTPDSIKQVVLSYQPQIQACYEETLAGKDKAVEGSLKTSFSITGDGMTAFSKVDKKASSLKDPRLHDCVIAVLSTMQFPAPPDGKAHPIEFPFNLKAVH